LGAFNPAVLLTSPGFLQETRAAVPHRVILLQPLAPAKPAPGQPCNGCGVCCAAEPCPLGMVLSRRRRGACRALRWSQDSGLYRCGVLAEPAHWLPLLPAGWVRWLARRWIATGQGCDSDLQALPAAAAGPAANG
jgi:hypothetical protein